MKKAHICPFLWKIFVEYLLFVRHFARASLVAQLVKNPPAMQETWVRFLGRENPLEKGKATHSSVLAWRIPWTVLTMGSQRVGSDFHFHLARSWCFTDEFSALTKLAFWSVMGKEDSK